MFRMTEYRPLFLTDDEDQIKAPPPLPRLGKALRKDRWVSSSRHSRLGDRADADGDPGAVVRVRPPQLAASFVRLSPRRDRQ